MNKVVILNYQPLTKRYFTTFYISELQEHGFSVEYLDFTDLIFRKLNGLLEYYDNFSKSISIKNYRQFIDYLKKEDIKNTLFIPICNLNGKNLRIFRILTQYKCSIGFFARGYIPFPKNKLKKFDKRRIFDYLSNLKAKLYMRFGLIIPYKYIFAAGNLVCNTIKGINKAKLIKINSIDYDCYLVNKDEPSLIDDEYCLFLDEYAPYHPDMIISFGGRFINAEDYYKHINIFFDKIEKTLNKQVVIAAHPKASKYKEHNFFNGRKVIFDKTCRLCAHASLIMTHASTSTFYAAMYQKKIIFLMSREYQQVYHFFYQLAEQFAKEMDSSLVYFDSDSDIILPRDTLNRDKRETLLYNYLTSKESEHRKTVDIFLESLR